MDKKLHEDINLALESIVDRTNRKKAFLAILITRAALLHRLAGNPGTIEKYIEITAGRQKFEYNENDTDAVNLIKAIKDSNGSVDLAARNLTGVLNNYLVATGQKVSQEKVLQAILTQFICSDDMTALSLATSLN